MGRLVPSVSICIPVFRTEQVLEQCLESIRSQTLQNLQIILVDDGSDGRDSKNRSAEKIFRDFMKSCRKNRRDFSFKFVKHSRNLGLVETRRSGVQEALAPYVYILDSDDTLLPDGLEHLLSAAGDADIVQGLARLAYKGSAAPENVIRNNINTITYGFLSDRQIFDFWLLGNGLSGYLIGKLFKRELYLRALDAVPFMECTMNEDLVQFFFLSYYARNYIGIQKEVFVYNLDAGITSRTKINDLSRWEKVCSSAAVFTHLFMFLSENDKDFTEDEKTAVKILCRKAAENRLLQLEVAVEESLKTEARAMLEDYWGSEILASIEKFKAK